jgi:RNA polymerase sigma factor (sigma-70 family)
MTRVSSSTPSHPPFQHLLDEHGDTVLRVLVVLLGREDAADAWQDTFTKAWIAYPDLTDAANLRGWLLTIARNVAADAGRARRRASRLIDARTEPPDLLDAGSIGGDDGYDAELWQRVGALPDKQRRAVVYRYVADLAYADIALLLDCSPDAARRSAYEGVRRLRTEVRR